MVARYRFLIPWALGAVCWFVVSLAVLLEYRRVQPPGQGHLGELWFLLSLLWAQFGFAGVFQAIRRKRVSKIVALVFMAVLPPLLLHVVILAIRSS